MAKEALDAILKAETEAERLLSEAREAAAAKRDHAEEEGRELVRSIRREAETEAQRIREAAEQEGEVKSRPILEAAEKEASRFENVSPDDFNRAVAQVVARVTGYGNR